MNQENLKKYANRGLNVLLSGRHGVGKTHIVKDVFSEVFGDYYSNWRYFSASTLDPWVDFIGIPKNYKREDGKEVFGIVPPEHFTGEEDVKAVFFDEINRADEKTLNALMELIQFKSINGRKYPNLKCVWAAENPSDDAENDYAVNDLDPAQKDRFHIQINVPYSINTKYFEKKFDKECVRIAKNWWSQNNEKVSPRKLEHLLFAYENDLPLQDFSNECNMKELQKKLGSINDIYEMKSVISTKDEEAIKQFFTVEKLRKDRSLLESRNDIIKSIYKFVDEETQNYIVEEFGFSPPNTKKSLEGKPKAIVESLSSFYNPKRSKSKTSFYMTKSTPHRDFFDDFCLYICSDPNDSPVREFKNLFRYNLLKSPQDLSSVIDPNYDYTDVIDDIFPFVYDGDFKSYHIDCFMEALDKKHITRDFLYFVDMFLLFFLYSKNKSTLVKSNAYNVIIRIFSSNFTYKYLRFTDRKISRLDKKDIRCLIADLGKKPSEASKPVSIDRIKEVMKHYE